MKAYELPGVAPDAEPWAPPSKYTRSQSSTLTVRQKKSDSSLPPTQATRNASATASASQYGRAWKEGDRISDWIADRCWRNQRNSGVVKPILRRRWRIFSGRMPRIASRMMRRDHPPETIAEAGSRRIHSTSSWSRKGSRDSMEWAIELRSS